MNRSAQSTLAGGALRLSSLPLALTMLFMVADAARGDAFTNLHDLNLSLGQGFARGDNLIHSNGKLYGFTTSGGNQGLAGDGQLFEYDILGDAFNVLHEYGSFGDGDTPFGSPLLFGT